MFIISAMSITLLEEIFLLKLLFFPNNTYVFNVFYISETGKTTVALGIRLHLDISVIFKKLNIWVNSSMSLKHVITILQNGNQNMPILIYVLI